MRGRAPRLRTALGEPAARGALGLALVVLAALCALAFALAARGGDLAVDVPRLTGSFEPRSGEVAAVGVRVDSREPSARVSIREEDAERDARVLAEGIELRSDRTRTLIWDGRLEDGRFAPPGRYEVRILLPDAGRDAVWIRPIRVEPPGDGAEARR